MTILVEMLVPGITQVPSGQSYVRIECSIRNTICIYHGIDASLSESTTGNNESRCDSIKQIRVELAQNH